MSSAPAAHCSTCGASLNAKGECLACLVRVAFDELPGIASPQFGDYEIARREDGSFWELGRGAMGVTYRAEDKVLNRRVALKVIAAPAGARQGPGVRDRFLREARAAAAFHHPNVAGVFHFGASPRGDGCYYAMELVEGETLEALVRRDGALKVEAALEMAVQVTRALVAAAAHGLIHRDLKPSNIMLKRNAPEGEMEVKVIDFGLAKAIADGGTEKDLTQGGFVGTPAFASPEQFSGERADARSDIYSLGVTLWYALTGEVPYEGKTIEEIRRGQTEQALPVAKLVARKVPKPVIQLLRRILALTPAERPASARELMEALELCRARLGHTLARPIHRSLATLAALMAIAAAAFFAFRPSGNKEPAPKLAPQKSIAVLPFQNMSDDKQNAYLSDGVHEEILTTLAKVADLKVISRTSVMLFRDAEKRNLRDIAQQLGVAYVLEGSVQRAANRVRVTVQLIDAQTDSHVWADRYDGDLADVFRIQSEIAQKIAGQLKAALSPEQQAALQAKPTIDPVAYDLYLRAREILRNERTSPVRDPIETQVALLDEAVARDPAFVPALCMLARVHLQAYRSLHDHTPARLELATKALEAAARWRPDAGEVHLTRAVFHYWVNHDLAPALAELALAERELPNDSEIFVWRGAIQRRQGRWERAIATMEQALRLDPRNGNLTSGLETSYRALRRYDDARRVLDNLIAWKPRVYGYHAARAAIDWEEKGDLGSLQKLIAGELPATADKNHVAHSRLLVALLERNYRAADLALSDYRLPELSGSPREYVEGIIAQGLGDGARAEAAFLRARERAAATLAAGPEEGAALMALAEIDAKLGRKEDALRAGEQAVELLPVAKDAMIGPGMLARLAAIYGEVGETERALEILKQAVILPSGPSYGEIKLGLEWDPLRNDPRFQKIVDSLAPKPRD